MRRWIRVGLILVMTSSCPAGEVDAELRGAVARVKGWLATGHSGEAEELLEGLTRWRGGDPRVWWLLARLRLKLGSRWAAKLALDRAAALASGRLRERFLELAAARGLEAPPERQVWVELGPVRRNAMEDACQQRRRAAAGLETHCPSGEPLEVDRGWPAWCPRHPGLIPTRQEHQVLSPGLVSRALTEPEAWLRERALSWATPGGLEPLALERLREEPVASVRVAALDRMMAGSGHLDPGALALVRRWARDPHAEVRVRCHRLLEAAGEHSDPSALDLQRMVVEAGEGRGPAGLPAVLVARRPDPRVEVVAELLTHPRPGVRHGAAGILLEGGGQRGLTALVRRVALAETEDPALVRLASLARELLEVGR